MQNAVQRMSGAEGAHGAVTVSSSEHLHPDTAIQCFDKRSQLDALENSLKQVESGMEAQSRTLEHLSSALEGQGGRRKEGAEKNLRVVLGSLQAHQNSPKVAGCVWSLSD